MGLTISAGDTFATFITGEAVGSIGMARPLYAFGRGTGGVSSVEYLRNSQTEDIYAVGADAQNAWVVQSTNPT